jgi:hypothetical protein
MWCTHQRPCGVLDSACEREDVGNPEIGMYFMGLIIAGQAQNRRNQMEQRFALMQMDSALM